MMAGLRVADDFELPVDYVTSTGGILAKKGAGKSNAAVVLAEAMYTAGVPWVAVDPKGDWWGIRSSADGNGAGLPIVVFGGRHGDIPLEPTAGAFIADLVLTERLTCVLDVSEFSRADVRRFLLAFGERLYRQADADPLHLFLEEAHEYLPQMVRGDDAQLVGAWQRIVKQGRFKGLGVTLISQRSASVNKDVLTQVDTLVMMRTTSPQDRAAVKAWIDVHGDSDDVLQTLPSLGAGEAWVWAPEWNTLRRIQFLRRSTFDSGATPKVGEKRKAPATLADVDLARIKEQMAETIEKAKADDPRELRKRIKALEAELAKRELQIEERVIEVEIPTPFVPPAAIEAAKVLLQALEVPVDRKDLLGARPAGDRPAPVERQRATQRPDPTPRREPRRTPVPRAESAEVDAALGKGERTVLAVLAQYPQGRTHAELAFLAGYSAKASTLGVILSTLRKLDLVEPGQPIRLTGAGADAVGPVDVLSGQELLDQWMRHPRMGEGERKVLRTLIDAYPEALTHGELCEITGYSPDASTMGVILSKLRKLGLVDKGARRVAHEFMESIS